MRNPPLLLQILNTANSSMTIEATAPPHHSSTAHRQLDIHHKGSSRATRLRLTAIHLRAKDTQRRKGLQEATAYHLKTTTPPPHTAHRRLHHPATTA